MMSDFPKNYNDFIGVKATTASSQSPLSLKRSDLVKKHYQKGGWVGIAMKKKVVVQCRSHNHSPLFSAHLHYFCVIGG